MKFLSFFVVIIVVINIAVYLYKKNPELFNLHGYKKGRYVRLERNRQRSYNKAIMYSNFIIRDEKFNIIHPIQIIVNPSLISGNAKYPIAINTNDPSDIVLVETAETDLPYIEYDLGEAKKIANVEIMNRNKTQINVAKKPDESIKDTLFYVLDENRNIIFEVAINDIQNVYSINIF
jgi:hypothetical protein